jgi:hypothetical protein
MQTPYGEIPERFVKDMAAQEMHDYLRQRYSRRRFLQGSAGAGTLAVAGPMLWSRSFTDSSAAGSPIGPQWIALGPDPATEMHVSWSAGAYQTAANVPKPKVRWGLTKEYGHLAEAASDLVPTPTNAPAANLDLTAYQHALLTGLEPDTTYHYSVSNDGRTWGPDTTFRTGKSGVRDFRFCATGPIRNNVVQAEVPPGGTIDPVKQGTTYICTGGGGAGLAASATSGWFGTSGGGDMATTGTGTPPIEVWGSETPRGIGSGGTSSQPDPATGWSAYRRGQYCHLVIDITAPKLWGGRTSMHIRAIDPAQSGSTIASIGNEAVMDNVTLVRKSVTGPGRGNSQGNDNSQ